MLVSWIVQSACLLSLLFHASFDEGYGYKQENCGNQQNSSKQWEDDCIFMRQEECLEGVISPHKWLQIQMWVKFKTTEYKDVNMNMKAKVPVQ